MNPVTEKEKLIELNKSKDALLFDNMYYLVLAHFPDRLDASNRQYVQFDKMIGKTGEIGRIADDATVKMGTLNHILLLAKLCHVVTIVSHKIGLIYDEIEPTKINKKYVKYYFEEIVLKRTSSVLTGIATHDEKVDIDEDYGLEDVKKYCALNKVKWYLDIADDVADLS